MNNLLALHGALGSKAQFRELEKTLAGDFELYSVNFSGHGGLEIPNEPFSIELFAGDVLSWMEKKSIQKTNIFGYSMGGYIALYLARHYPEKIGKIFTLATKFNWTAESALKEAKMLDPQKIKDKVPEFWEELKIRHMPQNPEEILRKTAEMMINLGKKNVLNIDDYWRIENEVVVGLGDRDKMVTIEETIEVYKNLKNGRLLVLPETPHPLEKVNQERLKYEITSFFK
jgi:pimeloyl-ACP methyl ester carboxylesterase